MQISLGGTILVKTLVEKKIYRKTGMKTHLFFRFMIKFLIFDLTGFVGIS